MSRHLSDHPRLSGNARLREFIWQERTASPHPAIHALRSRPQTRGDVNRKAVEYSRIARGRQT